MRELLIFGRSPFINELDLSHIDYDKYDVCCINYPIPDIRVHYVVSCDEWTKPFLAPKTEWISVHTGYNFIKTNQIFHHEGKNLSWACFSSSAAVSLAISRGYKTCYLIGVDLIEDNKPLAHYDGVINKIKTRACACDKEKKYIKKQSQFIDIYQTNPKVKNEWNIPFKNVLQVFS